MSSTALYEAERDREVRECPEAKEAVYNAMRFKLFHRVASSEAEWKKDVYTARRLDVSFLTWH